MKNKNGVELTEKEVANKTSRKISLIILAVGVGSIVLSLLLSLISPIFIFLIFIGFGCLIGSVVNRVTQLSSIKHSFCSKCGKQFDYENDVSWTESGIIETEKSVKSEVDFECECRHCGNIDTFSKKFEIASVDDKGRVTKKNLRDLVSKHFWHWKKR